MKKGLICILRQLALGSLVGTIAGIMRILSIATYPMELTQAWLARPNQFVVFILFTMIASLPLGLLGGFMGLLFTRSLGSCSISGYVGSSLSGLIGGILGTAGYVMLIIIMSFD
jgi:hypothetical protein